MPRTKTTDGRDCPPSEVDDWSSLIGEFAGGATGVWEGTTLAKGYGFKGFGHEWAEINGSLQTAVYRLHMPNQIMLGKTGADLAAVDVPAEFLKPAGSPRDPSTGEPATVFRYDLVWEFVTRDLRRARRRAQLLRRPAGPNRRRRGAPVARRAAMGGYSGRTAVRRHAIETTIASSRLDLVHLSPAFMRASLAGNRGEAERLLGASLPPDWPDCKHLLALRLKQMEEDAAYVPWSLRAMVLRATAPRCERTMIGHIGCHTRPGAPTSSRSRRVPSSSGSRSSRRIAAKAMPAKHRWL